VTDDAEAGGGPAVAPTTVFMSYSRADEKRARPIIDHLERAGYSVWWDGLLAGGERFARSTADALERAQAVVVLWSRTSIESHWVHDEAAHARDRKRLVPLSLDGSQPPLGFRQFQVIDVSRARRDGPEMRQLVEAVAALHAMEPEQRTPRPMAAGRPGMGRRAMLIGAGATVAVAGAAAIAWKAGLILAPAAKANTIAVLPFANMSGDPGQAYFADGLCAEIRAALARNAALRVVGQASSNVFRNRTDDAKTIARKLGVAFLLDGNVRRAPGRVRIVAELIDGATGFSTWSQTFDRPLDDIFAVQSEIGGKVTSALTREVAKAEDHARTGGTDNVDAYDAYLRGKAAFALDAGPETDHEALMRFDEAIAADPKFAAAHAARARTLVAIANQFSQGPGRRALFESAIASARLAVQLAPDLAEAQAALALALISGHLDLKAARAPSERSYQLGQGDAEVTARFAMYSVEVGRFAQAQVAIQQAETLDPLNPRTFWNAAFVQYAGHHYPEARALWGRAVALDPKIINTHGYIGNCLMLEGQPAAAEAEYQREPNPSSRLPGLAIVARRRGDAAKAQALFDQLVAQRGDNALYQQGLILAQWGEVDRAVATLVKARAAGDPGLFMAGVDPLLDPLRKNPRFSGLLHDLGFD
jgi:TolB-like protein/tetratricopeptide (TPR) repeat protein